MVVITAMLSMINTKRSVILQIFRILSQAYIFINLGQKRIQEDMTFGWLLHFTVESDFF